MADRLFQLEQEIARHKQRSQSGFSEAASYEEDDNPQNNRLLALQQSLTSSQFGYGLEFGLDPDGDEDTREQGTPQELFSEAKAVNYRLEFETDIEAFLRTYALYVNGALLNQINGDGQTVGTLIGGGFAGAQGSTLVSLNAPLVYAHFSLKQAASNPNYIPISAESVQMKFDNNNTGLPIYLIPYEGTRSLGVKLPRGNHVAYAITATLNGCTVEISGSDTEPYVSHSNVYNVTHAVPATQFANRQIAMTTRLAGLKTDFTTAETTAGNVVPGVNNVNNPNYNPLNFAFYANHANPPGYPGTTVDYRNDVEQVATLLAGGTPPITQKGGRQDTNLISHSRYMLTLTQASLQTYQDPQVPPNAIVVARRSAGNPGQWTFYYQEYASLTFNVREKAKVGPKLVISDTDLGNKNALVIMNSGK